MAFDLGKRDWNRTVRALRCFPWRRTLLHRGAVFTGSSGARDRGPRSAGGVTLVEVVAASLLVGLVLVAALDGLGAALRASRSSGDRARAALLAQDLMAEILQAEYVEPVDEPVFGPESGETDGSRNGFDDVDDYDQWSASPPQRKDGTEMSDLTAWRRDVSVWWADPNDLGRSSGTDQGVKRILVEVYRDGELVASQTALQTRAWIASIPDPENTRTTGSSPPVNNPPRAVAAGSPLAGAAPLSVVFDAGGSSDPDGDPLTYAWDFGDGAAASWAQPNHRYASGGVYEASLTVTDGWGAADTDTLTINVTP